MFKKGKYNNQLLKGLSIGAFGITKQRERSQHKI